MRQITHDAITDILASTDKPCVSLYQPTHRRHPDNQQDPIRYKNLVRQIEATLLENHDRRVVDPLIEKFDELSRDPQFWNQRTDGLAILGSPTEFHVFELQQTTPELLIVADSFHTKPLLRAMRSTDRFQVLCLSRGEIALYEGNRHSLDPVELEHVPKTIEEALGEELTEPHQTVASYGDGSGGPRSKHGSPAMFHGHGDSKDEMPIDRERFFRAIDRAVLEHHSRPSGLPLVLAALPEHHTHFRTLSRNPYLLENGITIDPMSLSADQLRKHAWEAIAPSHDERLAELFDSYHVSKAHQQGSDDLNEIVSAALEGRVSVLFIQADREQPGRIDTQTGKVISAEHREPGVDDVLDDLAETVLRMSGDVIVLATDEMPTDSGVAATYRF